MENLGHWHCNIPIPESSFGFIYRVENLGNGKYYYGKKQCQFKTCKKPLKGRVNKRRGTKTSDWKYYTGSSKKLNADIDLFGKDNFKFEIIKFCNSKSDLAYSELQYIMPCFYDTNSYNEYILVRLRNPKK